MLLLPSLVEKLEFATLESMLKPALCSFIKNRKSVEKGDSILGKGKWVFRDERVM